MRKNCTAIILIEVVVGVHSFQDGMRQRCLLLNHCIICDDAIQRLNFIVVLADDMRMILVEYGLTLLFLKDL